MTNENLNSKQCPQCKQYDQSIAVDEFYFSLLDNSVNVLNRFQLTPVQIRNLFRQLAPPDLARRPIWLVLSPDILAGIIVLLMGLISIEQQVWLSTEWYLTAGVFFALVVLYLFVRDRLIAWFEQKKALRLNKIEHIKQVVAWWQSLMYCHRDQIVFHPEKKDCFPVDQLQTELSRLLEATD